MGPHEIRKFFFMPIPMKLFIIAFYFILFYFSNDIQDSNPDLPSRAGP